MVGGRQPTPDNRQVQCKRSKIHIGGSRPSAPSVREIRMGSLSTGSLSGQLYKISTRANFRSWLNVQSVPYNALMKSRACRIENAEKANSGSAWPEVVPGECDGSHDHG